MSAKNTPVIKSKHAPVTVDAATYEKLHAYSEITGIPLKRVFSEAVTDWMETVGAARLEVLTGQAGKPLLEAKAATIIMMPQTSAPAPA